MDTETNPGYFNYASENQVKAKHSSSRKAEFTK